MAQELKAGDTVKLNSGGPVMTVEVIFDDGDCKCTWFADKQHNQQLFRLTSLTKYA